MEKVPGWTFETLLVHIISLLEAVEKRFLEIVARIDSEFKAQKELNSTIAGAAEKAITKAENAQRDYNTQHNDLSRKMEQQYAEMTPRTEFGLRIASVDDKIATLKEDLEKEIDRLRQQLSVVREEGIARQGSDVGRRGGREVTAWLIAIVMFLLALWSKLSK